MSYYKTGVLTPISLYYVKQDHPFNKTLEKFIGIGILNGHAIYMVYCAYREYVQGGRKKEEKAGA